MNPLHDLLERAAGDEPVGFDHTDVRARLERQARRRQRTILASSIAVLVLVTVGTVALAARDGDGGVVADSTTVSRDELTDDWWVAHAFSEVTVGERPVFVDFHPDGRMFVFDGCRVAIAQWSLEGSRLQVDDPETHGGCERPTELLDVLTDGATVGRPDGPPGTLELRSARGFVTFDQFGDLGPVPTEDDLLGVWKDGTDPDNSTFTFELAFERGGVARWTVEECEATSRWDLHDDRLEIEEPDWPTRCGTIGMANNLWDEASRVRVAGDNLWFADDDWVSLFVRVNR